MKKLTPIIFVCVMILMMVFSWSIIVTYDKNQEEMYQQQLQKAQKLENKGIYVDAVEEYERVLSMKPGDVNIAIKIADLYEELDQIDNYINALRKVIDLDPKNLDSYFRLADIYTERKQDDELYNVLTDALEVDPNNKSTKDRLTELRKKYVTVNLDDKDVGDLYNYEGNGGYCAKVKRDGKYGLISPGGSLVVDTIYDDIGLRQDSLLPVKKDGQYFYVDNNMYKKLVPDVEVDFFGTFGEGKAPAAYQGKYGYVDKSLYQLKNSTETASPDKDGKIVYSFEYDYAGAFANNTAAVKVGKKWSLINGQLTNITGFDFDDVLMDDYGFCSLYERIFVKKNNEYYMYDCQGNQISGPYEDARIFKSKQPAAVKLNGKWGFVDQEGKIVIEPAYDDAKSFCVEYAPVKINGKWGAIGTESQVLIDPQYLDFNSFSDNGRARVVNEENKVCFISVHVYSGDDK